MKLLKGSALLAAILATTSLVPAYAADVTQQRLENADKEPQNWLMTLGNYSSHRYSRLNQINRDNVKNLHVAFTVPITTVFKGMPGTSPNIESPPLVDDGTMFINDTWGTIYKIDVRDGVQPKTQWITDPAIDKTGVAGFYTRGVALWNNRVLANLIDGRVISVDANTGEIVWDKKIGGADAATRPETAGEGFTAAPLTADGKVLVGQSKGDWGTRGYLAALDVNDGKLLWKTYTVPAPGEKGSETWKDDHNAWRTGGGALWTTGSYDPAQKITYWGTANPVPMYDPEFRPGDNLFTNSVIGFDVANGNMKWYFQYTPNEGWDYDEIGVHILYDVPVGGVERKAVGHFGRNGFFYQLDRQNGQFLNAVQYADKVTWTAGIDPKTGKPVEYDPSKDLQTYIPATRGSRAAPNITVCPSHLGGLRWQPPSYNPDKRIAYAAAMDGCTDITRQAQAPLGPQGGNPKGVNQTFIGGTTVLHANGVVLAMDVTGPKLLAKTNLPYENLSGALDTAGGLVFTGNLDGSVVAYGDEKLDELWKFYTGISIKAPPISYSVNGKQYIAIIAAGSSAPGGYPALKNMQMGAMLYVFTL
ncbi:MAG: PQQ-binding-like beta-propeller repeat protein [Bauldia sp.]